MIDVCFRTELCVSEFGPSLIMTYFPNSHLMFVAGVFCNVVRLLGSLSCFVQS